MRSSTMTSAVVGCVVAASYGSHAFVVSKSSNARAAARSERRRAALEAATMDQMKQMLGGPVLDLRGGKTVGSKKGSSKTKDSSTTSKGSKASKANKGPKKPTFVATFKAFFHSLFNPHFTLKLQAKNEQHHTVHGSGTA